VVSSSISAGYDDLIFDNFFALTYIEKTVNVTVHNHRYLACTENIKQLSEAKLYQIRLQSKERIR
jgi:predicted KAP-like P-loop ATPase